MGKRIRTGIDDGRPVAGTEDRTLMPRSSEDTPEADAKNEGWNRQSQSNSATAPPLTENAAASSSKRRPVSRPPNANAPVDFSPAKTLEAPLTFASPARSLAFGPPLSSKPSPPLCPKSAAISVPPTLNAILPTPIYVAPPPPLGTAPPPIIPAAAPLSSLTTVDTSRFRVEAPLAKDEMAVRQLLEWHKQDKDAWDRAVGWYFLSFGRSPSQVIGPPMAIFAPAPCGWELDFRKQDLLEKDSTAVEVWLPPVQGTSEASVIGQIGTSDLKRQIFEEAIRRWANSHKEELSPLLKKACFTKDLWTDEWFVMSDLKKMDEGPQKEELLAHAKAESPRWYKRCMDDELCGRKVVGKRKNHFEEYEVQIVHGKNGRRETVLTPKRQKMSDPTNGRPTQFHAVPLEERAVDSQGRTLPWALEWHEDHPSARHQKRQPEEKGSFGKSTRRKGSSRIRTTTTPAKKENPTVDAFERAMKHDIQKAAEEARLQSTASSRAQVDGNTTSHHPPPSMNKEPTQVMLCGYSPSTQWAAISFYETVSSGIICEDYDREPPSERRKFPTHFGTATNVRPRPLTKAELLLSRQYHGGNCWIKVTFDSAEAAERAMYNSPHLLQGHWVYAQPFHGAGPEVDEPIPMREEDRGQGLLAVPKPVHRPSQTLGSSLAQNNNMHSRGGANTYPRSFTGNTTTEAQVQPAAGLASPSSSATASSATATGPTVEYPSLRKRPSKQPLTTTTNNSNSKTNDTNNGNQAATLELPPTTRDPHFFTHFPSVPRTVLRPAHEAFLPTQSWFAATMGRLSATGWLPGDMIGDGIPRLENGDFDWAHASLYWKIFYWIDSHFGTDYCGLKDE